MKNSVLWYVTPSGSCKNRRFGGMYRLHHQGQKIGTPYVMSGLMSYLLNTMGGYVCWPQVPCSEVVLESCFFVLHLALAVFYPDFFSSNKK
jgi:hypothetical protein